MSAQAAPKERNFQYSFPRHRSSRPPVEEVQAPKPAENRTPWGTIKSALSKLGQFIDPTAAAATNTPEALVERVKEERKKLRQFLTDQRWLTDELAMKVDKIQEYMKKRTEELKILIKDNPDLENNFLPEAFALVCVGTDLNAWVKSGDAVYHKDEHGLPKPYKDPYDVQILAGVVLNQGGKIAEMRTGEGKTLVATLPSYLKALRGQGVHIVTTNDYLAQRDQEDSYDVLHDWLGLKVASVTQKSTKEERQEAYNADITYATTAELVFDWLRDQTADKPGERRHRLPPSDAPTIKGVRRVLPFVILDEVDSILLDEAITPFIISDAKGEGAAKTAKFVFAVLLVRRMLEINKGKVRIITDKQEQEFKDRDEDPGDPDFLVVVNKTSGSAHLTEKGIDYFERMLGLPEGRNALFQNDANTRDWAGLIGNALAAHLVYQSGKDYNVDEEERYCAYR